MGPNERREGEAGVQGSFRGPGVPRWSGSSFSTAIVTGGFALLRAPNPVAEPRDLLSRLEDTAVSVEATHPEINGDLGAGRIDLDAATAP